MKAIDKAIKLIDKEGGIVYREGDYIVLDDGGGRFLVRTKMQTKGGIVEYSLEKAKKTIKDNIKMDKLNKKYGKAEGYKRWMRGEDAAVKHNSLATEAKLATGGKYGWIINLSDLEVAIKDARRAGRHEDAKKLTEIYRRHA